MQNFLPATRIGEIERYVVNVDRVESTILELGWPKCLVQRDVYNNPWRLYRSYADTEKIEAYPVPVIWCVSVGIWRITGTIAVKLYATNFRAPPARPTQTPRVIDDKPKTEKVRVIPGLIASESPLRDRKICSNVRVRGLGTFTQVGLHLDVFNRRRMCGNRWSIVADLGPSETKRGIPCIHVVIPWFAMNPITFFWRT